jgi:hypothetical protein
MQKESYCGNGGTEILVRADCAWFENTLSVGHAVGRDGKDKDGASGPDRGCCSVGGRSSQDKGTSDCHRSLHETKDAHSE